MFAYFFSVIISVFKGNIKILSRRKNNFYKGIYPYTDSYPKLLYMNLWLLNIGMECLRGELYSEFCLGIRNDVMIPYKELQIAHYEK